MFHLRRVLNRILFLPVWSVLLQVRLVQSVLKTQSPTIGMFAKKFHINWKITRDHLEIIKPLQAAIVFI